jgi:hypothetical protein
MLRFAAVGLLACGSPSTPRLDPPPAPPSSPPAAPPAAPVVDPSIAALNQRAGTGTRADRCGAVFELFDKHIKPGARAPDVAATLTDRTWITVDLPVDVLGGWVPVEMTQGDQVFVVHCVAAPNPRINNQLWSDWVIYGRIATTRAHDFKSFLAGPADLVLVEFALSYPDGRIEQYRASGRKSLHM